MSERKKFSMNEHDVDRINELYKRFKNSELEWEQAVLIELFGMLKRAQVIPFSPHTNT